MYITAHCFIKNVRITKLPIIFHYGGSEVSIAKSSIGKEEGLILQITEPVLPSDLKVDPADRDPQGNFIAKQLRPYKNKLHEIASLIEGILSVNYIVVMPAFETHKVLVNVLPENSEEEKMLKSGEVTSGFGDINTPDQHPEFVWKDELLSNLEPAKANLPALSFIAQAIRSQNRKDQEVAFFLYFRIIEGYFGDGTPNLEKALLSSASELKKHLLYDQNVIDAMQKVLSILKLPSKSKSTFEGFISDLVLIRHKMTHFDSENSGRYFNPELKFELDIINLCLRLACTKIIRAEIAA